MANAPGLDRGVTEDGALVTCSLEGEFGVVTEPCFERSGDSCVDVWGLAACPDENEELPRHITRLHQRVTHRLTNTRTNLRSDLASHNDPAARCHHFYCNAGSRILVEDIVKDRVSDQITELIGMADTHGLSSLRNRHTHSLSKESGHRKVPTHLGQAHENQRGVRSGLAAGAPSRHHPAPNLSSRWCRWRALSRKSRTSTRSLASRKTGT